MRALILLGGIGAVTVGAAFPIFLPQAPASIQSNETLQPIGSWIINNQNWLVLAGIALIIIALFVNF